MVKSKTRIKSKYLIVLMAFVLSVVALLGNQPSVSAQSDWVVVGMSSFKKTLIAGSGAQSADNPGFQNVLKKGYTYKWCVYVTGGSVNNAGRMNFFGVDLGFVNGVVVQRGTICTRPYIASKNWQYAQFRMYITKGWVSTSNLYLEKYAPQRI
ncbi:MAG: hypothetical protein ABI220_03130 [Candidatus Saccharimonadales bacterium]